MHFGNYTGTAKIEVNGNLTSPHTRHTTHTTHTGGVQAAAKKCTEVFMFMCVNDIDEPLIHATTPNNTK